LTQMNAELEIRPRIATDQHGLTSRWPEKLAADGPAPKNAPNSSQCGSEYNLCSFPLHMAAGRASKEFL